MSLEDFQNRHGREWAEIIGHPAFGAALALANTEKLRTIALLSSEEIKLKGDVILSDLVGFLNYESGLLGLHEKKETFFGKELGEPEYPDPIQEAAEEERLAAEEPQVIARIPGSAFFPPPGPEKQKVVPKKKGKRKIKKP